MSSSTHVNSDAFPKITQQISKLYPNLYQQLQTTIELSKGVEW